MLENAATSLKPWLQENEPPPDPDTDDGSKGGGSRKDDVDPDLEG